MELENLTYEEIELFCKSLTVEKEFFKKPLEIALRAEFLTGVRIDGELAGVGGLVPSYRFFRFSMYIVKSKFQRREVGTQITKSIVNYARTKGYNVFFATVKKENQPMLIMTQRQGYKVIYAIINTYFLGFPLNKKGEIVCKLLPLISKAYFSPLGNVMRFIRDHWAKASTRKPTNE